MKTFFLISLLTVFFQQAGGQVSGKLMTADSLPVIAASISVVTKTDTALIKTGSSNENGIYRIAEIPAGQYRLRISSVACQTWYSPVFIISGDQPAMDFGTVIMKEGKKQLAEVVVRAQKPLFQQRPDGTVVNIENSLLTKGSSVLEVLARSPGVVINQRDNSIALNGKNGVKVMLNGKLMQVPMEQVVALLNGMSADDIASIELLTTPPAKYDAEGSGGIINIIVKKNKKQGTSGGISLTAGYGKAEKGTAAVNLARNSRNTNLYGSYTFSHNRTYSNMSLTSAQDMPFLGGQAFVLYWDTTRVMINNHDATVGIDSKLNTKTTVGAGISYNRVGRSGNTITNAGYNILPDSVLQFNGNNTGNDHWSNLINSVYLEKAIREGEHLNITMDYLYFKNEGASEVQSSFINKHGIQAGDNQILFSPRQQGFANTTIKVVAGKTDYTKQLGKKIKLETGVKAAFTRSSSLSGIQSLLNGIWTGSDQTYNYITMKEGIGAVYASLNVQLNPSTNLVAGARYEYSNTDMNNAKTGNNIAQRKLGTLFPSLFFAKKISDHSELQLSYTKRISRPSYNDLASYVGYSDPTAVYTGNPFLKPTITNNIKLGYNYKSYSFSLLFSRDDNAIARYQLTESPSKDILYISPQNLDWQNNVTLQANLPVKINNWWSMNYGLGGGPRQYRVSYTKNVFEKTYIGYSFNFSQVFRLPANFSAELSGWYNNTSFNGTQTVKGFGSLNAGLKKELKNNAGSLQLSIADILMDQWYDIRYGTVTEEAFAIRSHVTVNTESSKFPIINLTYSRSFGGGNKAAKSSNSSQDERDRVRN